jgi:hypothetical protein
MKLAGWRPPPIWFFTHIVIQEILFLKLLMGIEPLPLNNCKGNKGIWWCWTPRLELKERLVDLFNARHAGKIVAEIPRWKAGPDALSVSRLKSVVSTRLELGLSVAAKPRPQASRSPSQSPLRR